MRQQPPKESNCLGVLIAIVLLILSFSAAQADSVSTENTTVQLISEVRTIQPGQPFWAALRMQIREGWHTYWRNPGDTGAKTTLDWSLPKGFTASDIYWPLPERIPYEPLVNYGYHDDVALLVQITPPNTLPTDNVTLAVDAQWLVCADICIPEDAELTLNLPVTNATPAIDERWSSVFAIARRALPQANPWETAFTTTADQLILHLETSDATTPAIKNIEFFPLDEGIVEYAAPQVLGTQEDGIRLTIGRGAFRNAPVERVQGVLVVHTQADETPLAFKVDAIPLETSSTAGRPVESSVAQTTPPITDSANTATQPIAVEQTSITPMLGSSTSLKQQFLFAFLGGLILNLMPCVFPILSIKALSFVDKSRKAPGEVRRHGVVFSAGVLSCFTLIAGLLIILRYAGAQIGWGFQLQSPLFVTLLAYLMFAVGLSFSGIITIGDSLMNIGDGLAARAGYAGSFFTGALATLVATPCSAPFMGTALGFALTQPWPVAMAVFQGLGLGLAFPYLVLSFFPALFRLLPKPGLWMERFKELLAFPMYGTAVWLIWVLTLQTGSQGIAAALTGLVLIAFAAWLFQITRNGSQHWRSAGNYGAIAALVIALGLVTLPASPTSDGNTMNTAAAPAHASSQGPQWEPFSRQRLVELRATGQPVFINFTAAWCITCLVNERVALSSPRLASVFEKENITYLKADWTNRNAEITQVLSEFGRSGVPLYVYYAAGMESEPILLPQLLTESIVLEQLGMPLTQNYFETVSY